MHRRRELAARYGEHLGDIPGLRPVADPARSEGNFQSYWVEVLAWFPMGRDGVLQALADADISARRGIMAAHRQPAHRDRDPGVPLPVTERLTDNTLILPLYHQLTHHDQDRVIRVLRGAASSRGAA